MFFFKILVKAIVDLKSAGIAASSPSSKRGKVEYILLSHT